MQTLLLVTLAFIITAAVSLVWLTVRAFKTTAGWGLAVMFLSPVSATVFGVKFWEKQREPFLLYLSTFTAAFALSIYLLTVNGGVGLLQLSNNLLHGVDADSATGHRKAGAMHASFSVDETPETNGMFRKDQEFQGASGSASSDAEENETHADAEADSKDSQARKNSTPSRYRLTFIPVNINDVQKYIGSTAKIKRKNVEEKEYVITGASPKHVELAQRSRNGRFSFHYKNSDIEQVRVLIKETY